ncbi:MAG: hypothetical protein A3F18_03030 [Legionellales bacterium RIFCSPHIGHO2_12_FULL_37_14]|nr:MAG: hypothetical protein A3F18_03030 [Legionellales bacterium RIFCSPHIGHO2_12_FULL_37_14]
MLDIKPHNSYNDRFTKAGVSMGKNITQRLIDERLFAHINNDAHLKGSVELEGNAFNVTIAYLCEYLNEIQGLSPEITQLQQDFKNIAKVEQELAEITKKDQLQAKTGEIVAKILNLAPNQFLLLPGGWQSKTNGHAMVYQISKDASGDILFQIINTGGGLEHHGKTSTTDKELYNPVVTYCIPYAKANKKDFCCILEQILQLQIYALHKQDSFFSDVLYKDILQQFSHLDGELVESPQDENQAYYTQGQFSGTCAERVLHHLIKSRFKDVDDYKRFIYDFKVRSLDDYFTKLKESGEINNVERLTVIEKAIHHQLRILNSYKGASHGTYLFPAEKRQADLAKFTTYLAEINAIRDASKIGKINSNQETINLNSTRFNFNQFPTIAILDHSMVPENTANNGSLLEASGGKDLLASLDKIIDKCKPLAKTKDHCLLEQLEHLINHLPLPDKEHFKPDCELMDFYSDLSSIEKITAFYNKVIQLQEIYFACCKRLIGEKQNIPKMLLASCTFQTIIGHINLAKYKLMSTSPFYSLVGKRFNRTSLYYNRDSALYATEHPELDSRLQQIKSLHEIIPMMQHDNTKYFLEIINSEPLLKIKLQKLYSERYGNNNSKFHYELKELNYTELYYFITHNRDPDFPQEFSPLQAKFALQNSLELNLVMCDSLNQDPVKQNGIKFLEGNEILKYRPRVTSPASVHLYERIENGHIPNTKFLTKDPLFHGVLDSYNTCSEVTPDSFYDSNHIQLWDVNQQQIVGQKKLISKSILAKRELYHLRRHPDTQIDLTLDYFARNMHYLEDMDYQIYLMGNLFQPGVLLKKLTSGQNSKYFFQRFDAFVLKGLQRARKNNLTQEIVFFMHLKYLVNQYAFKYHPKNSVYAKRMLAYCNELNSYLISCEDRQTKYYFSKFKFLTLRDYATRSTNFSQINELLEAYFYINAKCMDYADDVDTKFKFEHKRLKFRRFLLANKSLINQESIKHVFHALKIPLIEPVTIKGEYPCFEIFNLQNTKLYSVNIETGLVYAKNGMAYTTLPLAILNIPIIKILGITTEFGFVAKDERTYKIDNPPHQLLVYKDNDGRFVIHKKFLSQDNQEQYFQLMANSYEHSIYLGISGYCINGLGGNCVNDFGFMKLLTQRANLVYKNLAKNELIITNKKNEILFQGKELPGQSGSWEIASSKDKLKLLKLFKYSDHSIFKFEDIEFANIYDDTRNNQYKISLERYNLNLLMNKDTKKVSLRFDDQDEDYNLVTLSESLADLPFLQFKKTTAAKEIALIPIQRFVNKAKARRNDDEYYQLDLDTTHFIAEKNMKESANILWQYTGCESYYAFNMVDGEPKPATPAEALYLCYLYLGANKPKKAHEILEYCNKHLGGLEGSFEELRYIYWIFNALPYKPEQTDKNIDEVENPFHVACKLKVLSLFTRFKQQGNEFNEAVKLPDDSTNNSYTNQQNTLINTFSAEICSNIYSYYTKYQKMEREQNVSLELSHEEKKSLLNYYYDNIPGSINTKKPLGALGHAFVTIRLTSLKKELSALKAKSNPNKYDLARIAEITQLFQDYNGSCSKVSKLAYVKIDTSLPFATALNCMHFIDTQELKDPTVSLLSSRDSLKFDAPSAMNILCPNPSERYFLTNFPLYLKIAEDPTSSYYEKLRHFCYATLVSNRHKDITASCSNVHILCNVLYRIMEAKVTAPKELSYEDLLAFARKLPEPPIYVTEYKDFTEKIIKTSEEIVNDLPLFEEPSKVTCTQDELATLKIFSLFQEELEEDFKVNAKAWRDLAAGKSHVHANGFNAETTFLSNEEFTQGLATYNGLQDLQNLAQEHFTAEKIAKLNNSVDARIKFLTTKSNEFADLLLKLGNTGPKDQNLNLKWQIDIKAAKRKPLDMNRLLALFCKNDLALYKEETGLDETQIKKLHLDLMQYINVATTLNQLKRVKTSLNELEAAPIEAKPRLKVKLGDVLYAQNLIATHEDLDLAVYQLYADLLIRSNQKDVIKRLLTENSNGGYVENIERLIMGAGKTKILLPLLAYKKANGKNLVVIEVPRSLLRTNFVDLKNTSISLFGQDAFIFEFNRQSNVSAQNLEIMHRNLTDLMVNKHYLLTTNDALQSLELKYLELLHHGGSGEWQQQLAWLEKIIKLFKERGDLIIDEVHQGLLMKNKLNYALGENCPVNSAVIKAVLNLYKFFATVRLKENISFAEIVADNKQLSVKEFKDYAFKCLVHELVHNANSPLYQHIDVLTPAAKLALEEYLGGNATKFPDFFNNISTEDREILALYKGQLTKLLPHTLQRNFMEHYGPSKVLCCAEQQVLAIPYIANNKPNEKSRFSNYLETINYTIQSLLIGGVTVELLEIYLKAILLKAQCEIIDLNLTSIDDTPSAKAFAKILPNAKYALSKINLKDPKILTELSKLLSHKTEIIYAVLENHVLPNIKQDGEILHSDAYNHVDMLLSCQGFSGTPWNHSTFHQRLNYIENNTLGLDGLVFQAMQRKTDRVRGFNFTNCQNTIETLFAEYPDNTPLRAIIDINATFKGVANFTLAEEVANYLTQHKQKFHTPKRLRHILYFNEDNKITALPLDGYPNVKPIVIGSSDVKVINERLDSTPEERFTIYDQDHTTGTDITQAADAHALVFIDERTSLSNCFQGVMRMRNLITGNQRLLLVVPKDLATKNVAQLCAIMHNHEQNNLKEDNYYAACAKLRNIIRDNALKILLDSPNPQIKRRIFSSLREIFIESQKDNFWEKYGQLDAMVDTKDLLNLYAKALLDNYLAKLDKVQLALTDEGKKNLQDSMEHIISKATAQGACLPMQNSHSNAMSEAVEVQKEVQVENEVQKEMQNEFQCGFLSTSSYITWPEDLFAKALNDHLAIQSLNTICSLACNNNPDFTENIKGTVNFYASSPQLPYSMGLIKPVHALLFRRVNNQLECILLSQNECEDVYKILTNKNYTDCWLTTTHHTVLAGNQPKDILKDQEYQKIIEQIRFFNGEFSTLIEQKEEYLWLSTNTKQKMTFFTSKLYPYRETLPAHLQAMEGKTTIRVNELIGLTEEKQLECVAHLKNESKILLDLAEKTPYASVLEKIITNIDKATLCDNAFCEKIIANKNATTKTIAELVKRGNNRNAFAKLLSLVTKFQELVSYAATSLLSLMFRAYKFTVNLKNSITSNRFILFKTHSKEEKDSKINTALCRLNMALVKNQDIEITPAFTELSEAVCRRRNFFSALFCGKYSDSTKSAENISQEIAQNDTLLSKLSITRNKDINLTKKTIRAKMLKLCPK